MSGLRAALLFVVVSGPAVWPARSLSGQETAEIVSPSIAALDSAVRRGTPGAVPAFWAEVSEGGTPLVEPVPASPDRILVTFLWRGGGATGRVTVMDGVAGWRLAENGLVRLDDTDVWYRSYTAGRGTRFTYMLSDAPLDTLLAADGLSGRLEYFVADPLNPHTVPYYGGRRTSLFEGPDAPPQRWLERRAGVAAGSIEERTFRSDILDIGRPIWVYTPPGHPGADAGAAGYGLLVLFDGEMYHRFADVPATLDNLIAGGRIPPMVAVLVGNSEAGRDVELPGNPEFARFVVDELAAEARRRYGAGHDAGSAVVAGASYGGLAALYTARRYPDVFGKVLSQSGALWWAPPGDPEPEWTAREFAAMPRLPLEIYLDIGLLERGPVRNTGCSMVCVNRHVRDVLTARGYPLHYREFDGGHQYVNWRGTLADGLIALFADEG